MTLSFINFRIDIFKLLFGIAISAAAAGMVNEVYGQSEPNVRLKDIADIEGVRSNMLIGYGLVVGLNGTGDSANSIPFTRQSLVSMLNRLGVNSSQVESQLKTKNVAAVMITTELPAFARQGSRLNITVSSLGDSGSLEGGQLIATPMVAADGETYAVAQGPVIIGGFTAEGAAGSITKNHPTTGFISEGAIVERETGHELADLQRLRFVLKNPDFTTAVRVTAALNKAFGEPLARTIDNGTVDLSVPESLRSEMASIIQKTENVRVQPDSIARVVIDEKTGTIVMGKDVKISPVAISHSNVTVKIDEGGTMSQADAFAFGGISQFVPETDIAVDEDGGKFSVLNSGGSLSELVNGLNTLGVKPRDIISILQAIKASGALQADIQLL
ncbi:MAG: flagellar basal body P-ring protein FlgI [Pseudomonadota bacterium]|nr:flagellar basal body P-ring protein FlgI [Pseudomonadota bacterium]